MKIALVTFDYFTDLDLFLPWDLLNRVRLVGKQTDWEVKILGTASSHISVSGLRIPVSGPIEETGDADAVLFGSGSNGVIPLIKDPNYLRRLHLDPSRQFIGAMCSGALFLGALGLLTGQKATTYPSARGRLREYGVEVVHESFVETQNGRVATAAGCLAGQELSSWLIRNLAGTEVADRVLETVQPLGKRAGRYL